MISFIVNPNAGKGKGAQHWSEVEKKLTSLSIPYQVFYTESKGHATVIAKLQAIRTDVDKIVAIGGDGTVHEVVNGMWKSGIPFGYIPAGTGNDFALSNQIPMQPVQALERILDNQTRSIDILSFGDQVAVCNFGVGFDGEVAELVTKSNWKKRFGSLAYALGVLRNITRYQKTNLYFTIDGTEVTISDAWLAAICNLPTYGGGMRICPEADQTDGLLDVACVRGLSPLRLLALFPLVYRGAHVNNPAVSFYKGKSIQIAADRELVIHADGEIIGKTPIEIEILPKSLQIL
ncbi:diacylglycerol/lipid kinase family protein [Risungbinella massiliensis]|uniref:diacylglycerol/lipid kinase family protein n=1 Tax=Risungbinella massiliensis TaxID=1329796 RepID=UPI0005CC84CC|nr:diacylglycerol kinase family protein [Risungbinella massiliensis]